MKGTPCPTIWQLPDMLALASREAVSAISFDPCIYGAKGQKPTTLLLARLGFFREVTLQRGLRGRCNHGPGPYLPGKNYPAELNKALAEAFHMYLWHLNPENCEETLPDLLHDAGRVTNPEEVQPDYLCTASEPRASRDSVSAKGKGGHPQWLEEKDGLNREHRVSLLKSEERSDCPPVSPLSMIRFLPLDWTIMHAGCARFRKGVGAGLCQQVVGFGLAIWVYAGVIFVLSSKFPAPDLSRPQACHKWSHFGTCSMCNLDRMRLMHDAPHCIVMCCIATLHRCMVMCDCVSDFLTSLPIAF